MSSSTPPILSVAARTGRSIGGMWVDAGTYASATAQVIDWAVRGEPHYVCAANVHMLMETRDSTAFWRVVNEADLVTADGMPLVWLLRWRGEDDSERVYGPDLMLEVCRAAARARIPIALFGGTSGVLRKLAANLMRLFPDLNIVSSISPPFGNFTASQNSEYAAQLAASGARIVFVGLGCPKQETWMAECHRQAHAVLLGVGAAFNFHAGQVRQSPAWMQRLGLEWAFRLAMEPRRLWRRYAWHNPRFLWVVVREEFCRRALFWKDRSTYSLWRSHRVN
jgi:N-acetylglucosaminyldiphosphoundecaprenol N-acetyl-beta-D-mannosaminyltransferase